jgi:pyruvate formate lyase activating enzyme
MATTTLASVLSSRTREGAVVTRLDREGWVQCHACGHDCRIPPGGLGVCKVRFNHDGRLMAPWGYVAGLQCDPIEKKPFFHAWPGSMAYSFGMLGCDLHCSYCQNWVTSQALRDPAAIAAPHDVDPADLVTDAVRRGARVLVSTYNEPLITVEWSVEVFKRARAAGLATAFVSNGNATPQALDYLLPHLDLYKVDLKGFDDTRYRTLGARLEPILDTIRALHARGTWLEVVTLLVPGFNDGEQELRGLTTFLAGVSADIPWHVTAYHEDYRMGGTGNTTAAMLRRAAELGREAGLRYVYAGNLPGELPGAEDTVCPGCAARLIERVGFHVRCDRLGAGGRCPDCATPIPGRWSASQL